MKETKQRRAFEAMAKNNGSFVEVQLVDGLDVDGTHVKSISLRKPKVRDLLLAEEIGKNKTESQINVTFLANLTDLTTEQIGELSLGDFRLLNERLNDFLGVDDQKNPG